jgi:carnitine O-acetyltransferase
LPVPALEDTLAKYLESVKPFLSEDELTKTAALAKDFGKPGGEGEQLQKVLLKRAQELPNWVRFAAKAVTKPVRYSCY